VLAVGAPPLVVFCGALGLTLVAGLVGRSARTIARALRLACAGVLVALVAVHVATRGISGPTSPGTVVDVSVLILALASAPLRASGDPASRHASAQPPPRPTRRASS
jgi:hypothetical protein